MKSPRLGKETEAVSAVPLFWKPGRPCTHPLAQKGGAAAVDASAWRNNGLTPGSPTDRATVRLSGVQGTDSRVRFLHAAPPAPTVPARCCRLLLEVLSRSSSIAGIELEFLSL